MADWRYIMFKANDQLVPVIFPNSVIHSEMADGIQHSIRRHVIGQKPGNWSSKPVSAGFLNSLVVTGVHGKSESLNNLHSADIDRSIINTWPYLGGLVTDQIIPVERLIFEAVHRSLGSEL